jgi:hypothetical protein
VYHVTIGSDTYGRVKTVGGIPVVTEFFMVNSLPVYPTKSFYLLKPGRFEKHGLPTGQKKSKLASHGIPLARVDRTSVVMAYSRGFLATLILFGFVGSFGGWLASQKQQPNEVAQTMILVSNYTLGVGCAAGLLTYLIPTTTRRERKIRRYCGELLGYCIDPARTDPESASAIDEWMKESAFEGEENHDEARVACLLDLIETRCRAGSDGSCEQMEARTSELISRLDDWPGR